MTIEDTKVYIGEYMEKVGIEYLLDVYVSKAKWGNLYDRQLYLYGLKDHVGIYASFDINTKDMYEWWKDWYTIDHYLKDHVGPYYRNEYAKYVLDNSRSIWTVNKFIPPIKIIASHHEYFIDGMKEEDMWNSAVGYYPIMDSDYVETVKDIISKSKFHIQLRKAYGNNTPNTFDFIVANIPIKFVDKTHDEVVGNVRKFKKDLDDMVIHDISENKRFQKCGVPINFLRCTQCTLTRDHELVYTFELKGGKNE